MPALPLRRLVHHSLGYHERRHNQRQLRHQQCLHRQHTDRFDCQHHPADRIEGQKQRNVHLQMFAILTTQAATETATTAASCGQITNHGHILYITHNYASDNLTSDISL